MLIGFSELAGIFNLSPSGRAPYANEPLGLVCELARRHPQDTFVIINRITLGKNPEQRFPGNVRLLLPPERVKGLSDEVINGWAAAFAAKVDRYIVLTGALFSVGVLGIPKIADPASTVSPLQVALRSQGPVISALNAWCDAGAAAGYHRDPVYIVNDPRSVLKCRDLKWPPRQAILAQHSMTLEVDHYRYGDPRSPEECGYDPAQVQWSPKTPGHWRARHEYVASRYEIFASSLTVRG